MGFALILPARSGGRGTMQSMVEGYACPAADYPSTPALRAAVPLPKQAWGGSL